jgi:hypothetical protein
MSMRLFAGTWKGRRLGRLMRLLRHRRQGQAIKQNATSEQRFGGANPKANHDDYLIYYCSRLHMIAAF